MRLLPVNVPRSVIASSLINWMIWCGCLTVVGSQFLGLFRNSTDKFVSIFYGRSPLLPMTPLEGFNDEAYADRAIACITEGNQHIPKQLSKVLQDPMLAKPVSEASVHGFRVVQRESMTLSSEVYDSYVRVCDRLAFTMEAILDSCVALGYDTTRDGLRIVNGIEADASTFDIARALPTVIVPNRDNAVHAYFVTPSWDGAACTYSLSGTYESSTLNYGMLRGTPRSNKIRKAEEWLQKPGGEWRHGWYEDPERQPWMAGLMATQNGNSLGIEVQEFDTLSNKQLNCNDSSIASQCALPVVSET